MNESNDIDRLVKAIRDGSFWIALSIMLLAWMVLFGLLGCARPYDFGMAPIQIASGKAKGLNHVTTHSVEDGSVPFATFEQLVLAAKSAGCTVSRGPHLMPWMLAAPDAIERIDNDQRIIDTLRAAGIESVPVLAPDPETTLEQWRQFVRTVASTLHGVREASVGNEPDNDLAWPPERYAAYLHVAADELHGAGWRVCAPSVGRGKVHDWRDYLRACDDGDYDVLTLHVYDAGLPYVREALALVSDKPVVIEEDGAKTWTSAAIRGSYKAYLSLPRVVAVYWYCWWNPDDEEWSLVGVRGGRVVPTPAARTYAEIGR